MNWFEHLTGFAEVNPHQVRENMALQGEWLSSRINGRRMRAGRLSHPTLAELRAGSEGGRAGTLRVREVVADVKYLHRDPANADAVFQVASQFNLLEMVSPDVTPEDGIGRYERDLTQGPACAMACGAGTIFRNYFVETAGGQGQDARSQLNGLDALGDLLGNEHERLWRMRNGYALATREGLHRVQEEVTLGRADEMRRLIRVGVQDETEVTLDGGGHSVVQVYCSALPVAYGDHSQKDWEAFARVALDAAYEATVLVGLKKTGPLFLTLLGGGVFGNRIEWILDAMSRALEMVRGQELDVRIVSHGAPRPELLPLLARFA